MREAPLEQVVIEEARHLRLISNDLRLAGDCPLIETRLDENGVPESVGRADTTLADELWLIALRLDPEHAFDDAQDPDSGRVSD